MEEWLAHNSLLVTFAAICTAAFGIHYWWLRRMKFPGTPWILWLMAAGLFFYGENQARQAGIHEREHVERLTEDFARLYGSEMEKGGHWKLANNVAANDPLYLSLIEKEKVWETLNPDVADIYTIRKRPDGTNIFIVDSETDYNHNGKYDEEREQRTEVGEVYDKFDAGLEEALQGKANFDLVPITDRWGTWISAYVPLHDPAGKLDGVLGVDFSADKFFASITNAQLRVLGMVAAVMVILLGASILNTVLRAQIAERERTEESLRLLGSAVEQSNESIVITEPELDLPGPKIVFVNPAFTKMTGYTPEEVLGKTPRILQGAKSDRAMLRRLRETLTRGEVFHGETVNYRKDGTEFQVEWHINPIRDSKGTITHFVAIQRDISERKRFEEQLIQSQKLETVGKLAGGVAHEYNNILTAIMGHTDLILESTAADHPLATNAQAIRDATKRAATLTRQLLAYGRRQFIRPQNLNLNEIVTNMEVIIRHLLGIYINVRVTLAKELYTVFADAGQIEEVIMNVVMNAKDAMPDGGKLTLETRNITFDQESALRYPGLKPGNYATLSITDTGKGMSPEVKARAFEPFFSTKGTGKGTGLGLATSYGIIKQSSGHASIYSELGKGTTFRMYLPQLPEDPRLQKPTVASASSPGGKEIILVVEDDPTLLELTTKFLKQLGYGVLAASDGKAALQLLATPGCQPVDLLLTDIVMPNMDGRQLSQRVAELYPTIKILFASAYAEDALVHQGIVPPEMTLLEKPFSLSALAQKVRKALDHKI